MRYAAPWPEADWMLLSQTADSRNLTPPTTSPSEVVSQECGNASEIGVGFGGKCGGGVSAVCASYASRHRVHRPRQNSESPAAVDDAAKCDLHLLGLKEKASGAA